MRSLIIKINLTFHYFELKSVRLVLDKFLVIINIVSAWFLFCLFFFHFNIVCQSAKVHLLLLKLIIWTWKHFYSCGACNHATHFSNNLIQNVFSHKNIVFLSILLNCLQADSHTYSDHQTFCFLQYCCKIVNRIRIRIIFKKNPSSREIYWKFPGELDDDI